MFAESPLRIEEEVVDGVAVGHRSIQVVFRVQRHPVLVGQDRVVRRPVDPEIGGQVESRLRGRIGNGEESFDVDVEAERGEAFAEIALGSQGRGCDVHALRHDGVDGALGQSSVGA